ncbi:hypothetical protein AB0952_08640 [Streptomyces caniferus]|uniref:hypothetical protein n=1 Tax=Streptomyces caniferus TaxID=285557 RepID=UPI003455298A
MHGTDTDGWSWYVTRDGRKITSLGAFGHRADADAIAAAYDAGQPFPEHLPSSTAQPKAP